MITTAGIKMMIMTTRRTKLIMITRSISRMMVVLIVAARTMISIRKNAKKDNVKMEGSEEDFVLL
jgi:hypothetical protein